MLRVFQLVGRQAGIAERLHHAFVYVRAFRFGVLQLPVPEAGQLPRKGVVVVDVVRRLPVEGLGTRRCPNQCEVRGTEELGVADCLVAFGYSANGRV